jgi:hypothetical protein
MMVSPRQNNCSDADFADELRIGADKRESVEREFFEARWGYCHRLSRCFISVAVPRRAYLRQSERIRQIRVKVFAVELQCSPLGGK